MNLEEIGAFITTNWWWLFIGLTIVGGIVNFCADKLEDENAQARKQEEKTKH